MQTYNQKTSSPVEIVCQANFHRKEKNYREMGRSYMTTETLFWMGNEIEYQKLVMLAEELPISRVFGAQRGL